MPWIVVGRWGHEPSTVGRKTRHAASLSADVVDDLHGTHVVKTWIEPHLIQHQNPGCPGLCIQCLHLRGHVARGQHMHPCSDGNACHLHMHEGRKHADHQIRFGDPPVAVALLVRRHLKGLAMRMAFHLVLRRLHVQISHVNFPVFCGRLCQQMGNERRTASPCTKDQNHLWIVHGVKVARLLLA